MCFSKFRSPQREQKLIFKWFLIALRIQRLHETYLHDQNKLITEEIITFLCIFLLSSCIMLLNSFKSLSKDLLSVVSCFKMKGSKFWELHCILILSQYLVKKGSIYYWILALFVIDLEVCSFPNWWFLRSGITLRRYLLPYIIIEKYDIFFVWTKSFQSWNRFIFN